MVEAGEASGRLDVILERIVQHMEKVLKITQQVRSALIYPMTVLGVASLVLGVLLVWVIPMFEPLFSDFGDALPWSTALVLDTSRFLQRHLLSVFLGLLGLGCDFGAIKECHDEMGTSQQMMLEFSNGDREDLAQAQKTLAAVERTLSACKKAPPTRGI